jgi:hypothetical protein
MYRLIHPSDRQELPLRMLFHPVSEGVYLRACEANSFRGLVAALLNDADYERADVPARLMQRIRLANDVRLIAQLEGKSVRIADGDELDAININSDEPFLRSLHRLQVVSLAPPLVDQGRGSGS